MSFAFAFPRLSRGTALLGVSLLALGLAGMAEAQGPQGGVVAAGSARIAAGANRTLIRQSTRRAVIDWRRFDVSRDHTVVFDQPGRRSATLNRVQTAAPSVIEGAIRARGTVVIQNGAGVLFTEGARIDVGGLTATTRTVDAAGFARDGRLRLGGDAPGGHVVNRGAITVREAGLAALVGDRVENSGSIVAAKGTVVLGGGRRATLDLAGDGMLRIAVTGTGAVRNSGEVNAGHIVLTAGEAVSALDAVINTDGVLRARGDGGAGGRIAVEGRGAGVVRVGGTVDAAGARRGGSVAVTGTRLAVGPAARISVDGGTGRGGTVLALADATARIDGRISARGATGGGFVETSAGAALGLGRAAAVDVGAGGRWLLDPRNVVIGAAGATPSGGTVTPPPGSGAYTISVGALRSALDGGADVTITTTAPTSSMAGDITLNAALAWTGGGSLRLAAERDILISAPISTGHGDFAADAGRNLTVAADIRATGSASVDLIARTGDLRTSRARTGDLVVTTDGGALRLQAPTGSVVLRNWYGGLDVASASGALEVTAGNTILARGGAGAGQWVRVGSTGASADVTLSAPLIDVVGGIGAGSPAEVLSGAGGTLRMRARDRILVQDWIGGSIARIAALAGSPLTLDSATQCWFGQVQSGTGAGDGGPVTVAGAIAATVAPILDLAPGANFWLTAATEDGAASSYESLLPLAVVTRGSGSLAVDAPVAVASLRLVSEERLDLGAGSHLTTTDAGDALVLSAGRHFGNAAGAGVLEPAADGRWLLYLDDFDSPEGALPVRAGFDLYGRTLAGNPPTALGFNGSRIVYAARPVLTLTAGSTSKTYGETASVAYTVTGLRAGDSLAVALDGTPVLTAAGGAASANAGNHPTHVAATASAQGYRLAFVDGSIAVVPAPLTVTAADASRRYGAADPAFAVRYDGFVLGQGPADLGGTLTIAPSAAASSPVGRYAITPAGLASGNYAISYLPGTLSVTPAPLTVQVEDATRRYGGAAPAFGVRYSGFVLGEGAGDLGGALAFATPASAGSPVGRYAVTAGGLASGNYAISYLPGTLSVTPAPLTVQVEDATRRYGGAAPAFGVRYSGFVLGEGAGDLGGALAFATPASAGSPVGRYAVTAGGLASGNYAISYLPGTLSVTPAPLTVRVDDAARRYGAADPRFQVSYSGFLLGEGAGDLGGALRIASAATEASPVGRYAVTASGLASGNYAISYLPGTLSVTPAPLTVRVDDAARRYGAAGPLFQVSYSGFVLGEGAGDLGGALRIASAATEASPVGRYAVTASGLASGNYAISYLPGTLSVTPAPLTIAANDASRIVGGDDPRFSVRYSGFVLGDDPDDLGGRLRFTSGATRTSPAGSYRLSPSGLTSGNYAIIWVDGMLSVVPAPLPIAGRVRGFGDRIIPSRGVPPLTPGDASFRTTVTEAPPALANPFDLSYSLGDVVQLAPAGAAPAGGTQGFVPAAGGSDTQGFVPAAGGAEAPRDPACSGLVGRGTGECGRRTTSESYWTSRTPL